MVYPFKIKQSIYLIFKIFSYFIKIQVIYYLKINLLELKKEVASAYCKNTYRIYK